MGKHNLGFVEHLLAGSVAEKVIRHAPCPVLIVQHPEHDFVVPRRAGGTRRAMMWRALLLAGVAAMTFAPAATATAADDEFRRAFGDRFLRSLLGALSGLGGRERLLQVRRSADRARRTGRAGRLSSKRTGWLADLARIDPADLSPAVRADWAMLENELRWRALVADRAARLAMGSFELQRRRAICAAARSSITRRSRSGCALFSTRLANVPAYYAAAKASVAAPTREHTQLAIEQNRGALDVFGAELERTIAASGLTRAERATFVQRAGRGTRRHRRLCRLARSPRGAARERHGPRPLVPLRTRALRAEVRVRHPVGRYRRGALRARPRGARRC